MLSTDPIDLRLDVTTWDIVIPPEWITGIDGVTQVITIMLRLFKGELFWNRDAGMPWLPTNPNEIPIIVTEQESILGQKFNQVKARAAITELLFSAPAVTEIITLIVEPIPASRTLSISWEVRVVFDDTVGVSTGTTESN